MLTDIRAPELFINFVVSLSPIALCRACQTRDEYTTRSRRLVAICTARSRIDAWDGVANHHDGFLGEARGNDGGLRY